MINIFSTKKKDNNYLTFSATNDEVFRRLLDLFDGKVGKPFSVEEKLNIEQEGEKRYASKIPPGYRDNKKQQIDLAIYSFGRK